MNTLFYNIYLATDRFLIVFYRLTDFAMLNFMIGTFVLAFLCVVIGELSVSLALKFNKRYVDEMNAQVREKERLSIAAYQAGDKKSYRALNQQATDVWGKSFFTMVAHSAGILWPLPFAIGWLGSRFAEVVFPVAMPLSLVFEDGVGYPFTFIPMYILCRILFKYMRPHLPYFRGVQKMLDAADEPGPSPAAVP
jgi:hypothetical protein